MSTEIRWKPPKGYEGTHAEAVALAMERQLMACENDTAPCPHWTKLSQHERDMAVLEAANHLTALRRITAATEQAATDVDEIRARWAHRDPGLLTIVDHAVTDVRALLAERDQFRDSAVMYSAMVADGNAERDRLRTALEEIAHRSVQRDLSQLAKAALAGQQNGEIR